LFHDGSQKRALLCVIIEQNENDQLIYERAQPQFPASNVTWKNISPFAVCESFLITAADLYNACPLHYLLIPSMSVFVSDKPCGKEFIQMRVKHVKVTA
jgi:hypothetical protein